MDDLNNRLRAGILDLRSLAAGLKEEEKASAAQRAQDAQELAEGETSPRGQKSPEVAPRSPPRPPPLPTPPLPPDFSHLSPCPSRPLPPPPLPLRLLPERASLVPPHPSTTLHAALCTINTCSGLRCHAVLLSALCTLHAFSLPASPQLHASHPPRTSVLQWGAN